MPEEEEEEGKGKVGTEGGTSSSQWENAGDQGERWRKRRMRPQEEEERGG